MAAIATVRPSPEGASVAAWAASQWDRSPSTTTIRSPREARRSPDASPRQSAPNAAARRLSSARDARGLRAIPSSSPLARRARSLRPATSYRRKGSPPRGAATHRKRHPASAIIPQRRAYALTLSSGRHDPPEGGRPITRAKRGTTNQTMLRPLYGGSRTHCLLGGSAVKHSARAIPPVRTPLLYMSPLPFVVE